MDRRESMALPGSASYYMQREMAESGPGSGPRLQGPLNIHSLANPNDHFQPNIGSSSIGSTFQVDSSFTIPPHGVNVVTPAAMALGEPPKRKRGRPRKYGHGPSGAGSLGLSPSSSAPPTKITPIHKRGRGRPPGTGQKQQLASLGEWLSGSAGMEFTPHVINIAIGEDVATKVMSFSQRRQRAICILSANGVISTATIRQPSTSGGSVTYEGSFEILCLSGTFLLTDNDGGGGAGGLSVSLATPEGDVIGGGVGGVLIAASPVQVIVGSFLYGNPKMKNREEESGGDSERQTNENPASSMGVWSVGPRSLDGQNVHLDIDLMRG